MRFFRSCRIAAFAVSVAASGVSAAAFEPLFVAGKVVGSVRIVRPDGSSDVMRESHAYPYGSRIEVPESLTGAERRAAEKAGVEAAAPQAMVILSSDYRFRLGPGAVVAVLDDVAEGEGGEKTGRKIVRLDRGTVSALVTAPVPAADKSAKSGESAPADDSVIVRTPLCDAFAMSEQNQIRVSQSTTGSGWNCRFAAPTGRMQLSGRQFKVPRIKRNTEVEISGTEDYTRIAAPRGEFTVEFEKGADATEPVQFKSRMVGKIARQYAAIGHRMAVSVMVSYPPAKAGEEGALMSYSYLEGQTGVGVDGRPAVASAAEGSEKESSDSASDPFASSGSDDFGDFGESDSETSNASSNDSSAFAGFDDW